MLQVERSSAGYADVLELRGELDAASAPLLRRELALVVERRDRPLLVDLSDLAFIGSSGLSLLLNAQRRLSRRRRAMATVARPGPVSRVLEVTWLAETLGLHPDRGSAVAALGGRALG